MEYTGFWNQVNKITNHELLKGNSQDIQNLDNVAEVRTDLRVERLIGTNIWGTITDCNQKPLCNHMVKLIRSCQSDEGEYFKVVDYTLTDCNGYYRLDTYGNKSDEYHILVEGPEPVSITCDSQKAQISVEYETITPQVTASHQSSLPEIVTWEGSHQMNVYDYTQDQPSYRSLNNYSSVKFYSNNTYSLRQY